MMAVALAAAAAPQDAVSPIAPPMPQITADCGHPVYATDQLVCADPAIRALDTSMAEMLGRTPPPALASAWIEDQEAWFRRRSLCAFRADHVACARAAYRTRMIELALLASPPGKGRVAMRCSAGYALAVVPGEHGVRTLIDGDGRIWAIAFPEAPSDWANFVTYRTRGRALSLKRSQGGETIRCR